MNNPINRLSIFAYVFLFISSNAYAKDNTKIYMRERADEALMLCLNINYSNLGAYKTEELKDYSAWTYNLYLNQDYSAEGSFALTDFVEKNAGNFYKENLSLKAEGQTPPFNAIFARCMDFYRSKKLKQFLIKTKP